MKFKFGVTVMNTPFPNSPDSFDVLGTLDSEDSSSNLQNGLFHRWVDHLNIFFDDVNPIQAVKISSSSGDLIELLFGDNSVKDTTFTGLNFQVFESEVEAELSSQTPIIMTACTNNEKYVWKMNSEYVARLAKLYSTGDSQGEKVVWQKDFKRKLVRSDVEEVKTSFLSYLVCFLWQHSAHYECYGLTVNVSRVPLLSVCYKTE